MSSLSKEVESPRNDGSGDEIPMRLARRRRPNARHATAPLWGGGTETLCRRKVDLTSPGRFVGDYLIRGAPEAPLCNVCRKRLEAVLDDLLALLGRPARRTSK